MTYLIRIHWEVMFLTFLAIDKINFPFYDIKSLLSNTNYQIVLLPGSSNEDYFRMSEDEILQKAWKQRIEPNLDEYKKYGLSKLVEILDRNDMDSTLFIAESYM